jgi:hypothetical protein
MATTKKDKRTNNDRTKLIYSAIVKEFLILFEGRNYLANNFICIEELFVRFKENLLGQAST